MSQSAQPVTPYKGLVPYDEADAPLFFGRDRERDLIIANLLASRLTLLYGVSGVGKSSVLRAGAISRLRERSRQNIADTGEPEFAVAEFSSWSADDPVAAIVTRIQEAIQQLVGSRAAVPALPARSLAESVRLWSEWIGGDLLIILDQFEEYFLYHGNRDGPGTFAVEFPAAVNQANLRVSFLISIREDALAKLDFFKGRIPNLFANYLRINHLDRLAARDAIIKPLRHYQGLPDANGPTEIEEALVEAVLNELTIVQDIHVETGHSERATTTISAETRIETPYLQLVMSRLWLKEQQHPDRSPIMRFKTLQDMKGAKQIVREHLDSTIHELPAGLHEVAARAFRYLVTPSGTKFALTISDLATYTELPQPQLVSVIEELTRPDVRILRPVAPPSGQDGALRYEIFHDVLAVAILDWRARYVQAQERAEAERKRAEAEQKRAKEQAQRTRRLLRISLAAIVVALLIAGVVSAQALYRQSIRRQAQALNPLLALQGGRTTIGTDDPEAYFDEGERPLAVTQVDPFSMQKHEVTNQEIGLCLDAGACRGIRPDPNVFDNSELANYPASNMNALQAEEYCHWIGGRLPTDIEWEHAARGVEARLWPWGDTPPSDRTANVIRADNLDSDLGPKPVGSFLEGSSPEGLLDLVGNVWEWTSTNSQYFCEVDPKSCDEEVPESDEFLILRGGSWDSVFERVTQPLNAQAGSNEERFGFRCVT